jgi:hypothetical protein
MYNMKVKRFGSEDLRNEKWFRPDAEVMQRNQNNNPIFCKTKEYADKRTFI